MLEREKELKAKEEEREKKVSKIFFFKIYFDREFISKKTK
jgi:hypothetical protein